MTTQRRRCDAVVRLQQRACGARVMRRAGAPIRSSPTRWHAACVSRRIMDGWLTNLVEPLYGIVDLFLDRPFAAVLTTSVAGALFAAMVLSLR